MKTAVLQIRLDADMKKQTDAFFNGMGLDTTSGMRLLLKQCLLHRRIPFDVIAEAEDPFYSEENQKAIKKSLRQIREGKVVTRKLIED